MHFFILNTLKNLLRNNQTCSLLNFNAFQYFYLYLPTKKWFFIIYEYLLLMLFVFLGMKAVNSSLINLLGDIFFLNSMR